MSMTRSRVFLFLGIVIGSMAVHPCSLSAADPLHKQIDNLVEAHAAFREPAAAMTDDAAFLRRVHLDLTGSIPSATQVREFLTNSSCDKRQEIVDKLLDSPHYARRMQYVFDVMLMERQASKHITAKEWQEYLRDSFLQNKSWVQLSREILTADGTDETTRPAAKFLLDRELKVDSVTRDIGRIFLGRDLQCAQCHDHPAINDYLQRHYYGLAAFIKRSYLFTDPKTKKSSIGEKAEGDVEFTSVFTSEKEQTAPRMLDSSPITDPPSGDELYKVKPAKNVRSVPIYSRRLQLAKSLTENTNAAFRLNIANRMWALMMGRGLVEPVDMWHAENPPSHPELLDLLAESLLEHDFDMRYLLRELALSKTYQRSSLRRSEADDLDFSGPADFSVALLKPLSPEQLGWSMMQATGVADQKLEELVAKYIDQDEQTTCENTQIASEPIWQEQALHEALRGHLEVFAKVFGFEGVQNGRFDASAGQALFLRNDELIQSWVALENGISDRLAALDHDEVAEEFYLSVFSRMPAEEESKRLEDLLKDSTDRKAVIQQLVWASLVSAEFRFNF
jgi:hypothetical protein